MATTDIVLLISLETLKRDYFLDENVEDKYVVPNIKKAQDFIIRPLLGDKYDELVTKIKASSLTDNDKVLVNQYVQPVIAYYVASEVVYTTAYKMKNNPDYQNSATQERFNELVKISQKYLNDSRHYEEILKEYMCDKSIPKGEEYEFKCNIYLGKETYSDKYGTIRSR